MPAVAAPLTRSWSRQRPRLSTCRIRREPTTVHNVLLLVAAKPSAPYEFTGFPKHDPCVVSTPVVVLLSSPPAGLFRCSQDPASRMPQRWVWERVDLPGGTILAESDIGTVRMPLSGEP